MKHTELKNLIKECLLEFKSDMGKQCVMLMGLPASGKSSLISSGILGKYIAGFKSYSVSNSDAQVKALQYQKAKEHYDYIEKNVKTQNDFDEFTRSTRYDNPYTKSSIALPITWAWWKENKDSGLNTFVKTFFKPYYSVYFDIRELAIKMEKDLFDLKIVKAGNILIIDTTGTNVKKAAERFKKAKQEGYTTTVVYLSIDPELCISRDNFRKLHSGRGVGENVIMGYAKELAKSVLSYKANGESANGWVDRIIKFRWVGGASPTDGKFSLVYDIRYDVKRKLEKKGKV